MKVHPKKSRPEVKDRLHARNRHRERYDFKLLCEACPELKIYVILNIYNDETIDFSNPEAVKTLNKALLKYFYDISDWDIPQNYLCPPIPGRADYIHYIAELLGKSNHGMIPEGPNIKCLDIGVGANCVYPIIGYKEYGWSFVGSDIDPVSIESAGKILQSNPLLLEKIDIRLQPDPLNIFNGIIKPGEFFDLTVSNPPFHASFNDAQQGTRRKLNNLNHNKKVKFLLNFGGQDGELWCQGGEEQFIKRMIQQSREFSNVCFWFTTLVAKESHLKNIYAELNNASVTETRTISMGQGNKTSRLVAWTFLNDDQRQSWVNSRFSNPL